MLCPENGGDIVVEYHWKGNRNSAVISIAVALVEVPFTAGRLAVFHQNVMFPAHFPVKRLHEKPLFTLEHFFYVVAASDKMFGFLDLRGRRESWRDGFQLAVEAIFIRLQVFEAGDLLRFDDLPDIVLEALPVVGIVLTQVLNAMAGF